MWHGGFGEVYEAHDQELDEKVALKVLRKGWLAGDAVEYFKNEVRLARKIQSPHVCRVHDVGRFDRLDGSSVLFFSMEFLPGETLAEYLSRNGRMNRAEAIPLLLQMTEGLAAAHKLGVLHRDLKSANVMLVPARNSLRAVLTDFGLAASLEHYIRHQFAGTPAYMAPEQVEGTKVGASTDIYAIGVIAYEMATGKLPYAGATPDEQARARLSEPPIRPSLLNPRVDRRWEKAILKCLAHDPADRFLNAADLASALKPARTGRRAGMGLLATAIFASGIWLWHSIRGDVDSVPDNSVLVLPFRDDGGKKPWQADALSDDLTAEFADVPGLRVLAQSTTRQWTGKAIADIRGQLKVANVLSGSVRGETRNRVRVAVQLADSGSGYLLWSRNYELEPKDLPHLEETIVIACVQALKIRLAAPQIRALESRQTQIPEAYEAYLLGHYFTGKRTTQGLQQAIENFGYAVDLDPHYALAYAGLAGAYSLIASRGVMALNDAYERSEAAADRAISLSADLPEALLVKGFNAQHSEWNWDSAEGYLRQCAKLSPGSGTVHQWLAGLLSIRGRHAEALAEASEARDLDPLSPAVNSSYGTVLYRARRYDEALERLEWVVHREPAFMNAKLLLAEILSQVGRSSEAIQLAETVVAADHKASYALAELGYHYARAGRSDEARKIASELESRYPLGDVRPSEVAMIYNGLGEFEVACGWLQRGLPIHDQGLTVLKVDPSYDILQTYPRFRALIETLKL
jgi:serine/threonine protein kinase/tetratricopeptide (TPR) repeat protein